MSLAAQQDKHYLCLPVSLAESSKTREALGDDARWVFWLLIPAVAASVHSWLRRGLSSSHPPRQPRA